MLLQLVRDELTEVKERYGDERRTEIQLGGLDDIEDEDLIPEEQIVITLSHNNYIKRLPCIYISCTKSWRSWCTRYEYFRRRLRESIGYVKYTR